jgi:YVTN family beta-propeller protein
MINLIITFFTLIVFTVSLFPQVQVVEQTISLPDAHSGILSPACVEYSAISDEFYIGGTEGGYVIVIDGSTNQKVARIETGFPIGFMGFNSSGNKLYCAEWGGDDLAIIDCFVDEIVQHLSVGLDPELLKYNPANNSLYVGKPLANDIVVLNCATNTISSTIMVGDTPKDLEYNPVDNKIYCANENSSSVSVINCTTNTVVAEVPVGIFPYTLCYHPVENKIFCGNWWTSDMSVIDGITNQVTQTVPVGKNPVNIIYNPLQERMFVACLNGSSVNVLRDSILVGVKNESPVSINNFHLEQNYPNPFNPGTTIKFTISPARTKLYAGGDLRFTILKVYDVLGNEITTLINEELSAGEYEIEFSAIGGSASGGNAANLSSGIYFYQLRTGEFIQTKKMILIK